MNSVQENATTREDLLRELNLFPLWQLREPELPAVIDAASREERADFSSGHAEVLADAPLPVEIPQQAYDRLGWPELESRVNDCSACELRAGCSQSVFGSGDLQAEWMFVGSWPSEDDEAQGVPFAGQAGQLLDNMLAAIGLRRNSKVYLANVVKCCGAIKRGPSADQIARCMPYLQRQLQLVQPKLLIVLGHAAATALLGEDRAWESINGKVHQYAFRDATGNMQEVPMIVTFHPAALLLTPLSKAQVWKDLRMAQDLMSSSG